VFALFVPPFEVTILNHSPRLILAVPSKVSVQKMGKSCFVFIFDPTWYITDVMTTSGHDAKLRACHCRDCILRKLFFGCSHTQVKAQNLLPLLIFS
jgi:hypothetical protein